MTLLNDCSIWAGGDAAGRGGGVPVGGAIDIDSEEKNEKKAKESQHLFPGQQGAAEHKSDLPPHPSALAACSETQALQTDTHTN